MQPSLALMPLSHRWTFGHTWVRLKYCKVACHRRGGNRVQWHVREAHPSGRESHLIKGALGDVTVDAGSGAVTSDVHEGASEAELINGECECLGMDKPSVWKDSNDEPIGLSRCGWKPDLEIIQAKGSFDVYML